jgi:hypothetical protein
MTDILIEKIERGVLIEKENELLKKKLAKAIEQRDSYAESCYLEFGGYDTLEELIRKLNKELE